MCQLVLAFAQSEFFCFSDVTSEDSDMKFSSTHIPFPSSDVGNTVQGLNKYTSLVKLLSD